MVYLVNFMIKLNWLLTIETVFNELVRLTAAHEEFFLYRFQVLVSFSKGIVTGTIQPTTPFHGH